MYGKFFKSAFSGSLMASGPEVFAVWAYVIANTVDSRVELNPRLLAAVIGSTPDRMTKAIETLCAPDTESRSKDNEGRRMIKEGTFQYFVVNHAKYREIRSEDDRREYNKLKKREERARKSTDVKSSVIDSQRQSSVSANTEADTEAEASSVAKATGAKAPAKLSADEIIFGYGLPLLTTAGTAEKQARSFLGGLRKSHGDDAVVNALRECIRAKPLQPLEWLAGALKPKVAGKQTALESRNAALADRLVKEFQSANQ